MRPAAQQSPSTATTERSPTAPWVIDPITWDHIADAIRHADRTGLLPSRHP